jgi:hypothetical protein
MLDLSGSIAADVMTDDNTDLPYIHVVDATFFRMLKRENHK